MAITVKEAQTLYVSYFGRPADFVGLQYWTGTDTLVGSLEQLAHSFYNSAEGKKYFPVDPATNQINVTASINAIYANMFGRVPETAGFDYWYNEIASGKINLAEAAVAIYKGAQGKDALMIENKIAAATQFTDQVAASDKPSLYYGDQAFAKANEFLNTVTDTTDVTSAGFAAQVNAAVNAAEAAGAVAGEGGTFTLTATTGAVTGILTNEVNVGFTPEGKYLTAGNDVVDLSNWNGSGSVNIGDAFSNDNDKVAVMAKDLAAGANLKLTSIENLEIINANVSRALNLVGANFKGLESIEFKGDATTLNVSDFTYGVKIDATENYDNIFGGFKADTINGGAGNDTIQGNQGDDVLTGGNGADTFIIGNAKDFGVDQILDFSAEDKISMDGFAVNELKKFDASTFSTVTYKTLDSVLATFAAGGANVTKPNDVVIFSYDGKTYALLSTGAGFKEANDALVDITGANVASLTESNFGEFISQYNYANVAEFNKGATQGLIPANTAIIEAVGSGDEALKTTDIQYIKDGGILSIASGATVSIELQGSGEIFDANDYVAKFASKTPALNIIGGTGNDVITAPLFGGTINGGSGDDEITAYAAATINGGDGNDKIDASAAIGAVTIEGGAGKDTISLGAGADVVKYSKAGETASVGSKDVAASSIVATVTVKAAQGADTINNVKVGDKIDISAVAGTGAVLGSSGAVIQSSNISSALSTSVDVLLIKDNADYFLVYEGTGGTGDTSSLGSGAEIIKLVGLTDSNKITIDKGIVTIA